MVPNRGAFDGLEQTDVGFNKFAVRNFQVRILTPMDKSLKELAKIYEDEFN